VREQADQAAGIQAARVAVEGELVAVQQQARQDRAAADRARSVASKAESRLSAAAAAVTARSAEVDRAREAAETAAAALAEVEAEQEPVAPEERADGLPELQRAFDVAREQRRAAAAALTELRKQVAQAQREHAGAVARAETLASALTAADENSGTAFLASALPGALGNAADRVTAAHHQPAVLAALGALSEGLVVADPATAAKGLQMLRERGVDRAEFVVAATGSQPAATDPPVGRSLAAAVGLSGPDAAAVARLLADFVLVADLDEAVDLVSGHGDWVAVTATGDVLARHWARGGVRDGSTRWDMRAALEAAQAGVAAASQQVQAAEAALSEGQAAERTAAAEEESARNHWQDERTRQAATSERRSQWLRRQRAARDGDEQAQQRLASLEAALAADRAAVAAAEQEQQQAAADLATVPEPDAGAEPSLIERLGELRSSETEARLGVRTLEERAEGLAQRSRTLLRSAEEEERSRERLRRQQEQRRRRAETATAVAEIASDAQQSAEHDLAEVSARRLALRQEAADRQSRLSELRNEIRDLESEVARLTDSVHRDEVARAEQRLRIEQIAEKALGDHGISAAVLTAEYGPDVLVPASPVPPGDAEDGADEPGEPYPYVRVEQERRLRAAERSLSLLGTVNPLALEEFAAAEERYTYLNEQIEDMRRTSADLQGIVKDVDARVEQVFAEAFADTAEHFERVFARLFPGGEGRLVLTDPKDLLTTGIEVEARPPGKKIKRLSLLSGGERSLTAVAFLIALFKARPSPFYVLDEVEAALDDTNLGRLIDVIEELRSSSQLIIITHQKRTMEAADALYGVTMQANGVTQVISQRLAERPGRPQSSAAPGGDAAVIDLTDAPAGGG
jgi:chromosome segregation protein